jgi:adenine-specific DNA-methyltransferase
MTEIPHLEGGSPDAIAGRLYALRELFPEAFSDGKFDPSKFAMLTDPDHVAGKERYGLTWPGKSDCVRTIRTHSYATLKPAKEESLDWDSTENLFIEGDNLEALKLLQKSYYGKVKIIYIDPPYNTGKDFIYPDNYSENIETYLRYTGQLGENDEKLGTNRDTDGRFHSKWLNMMWPRLYLAKNLLREDGVIFMSIDDHEVANLRMVADEIF